jgi:glycerol-3-phosphate dehydrogenase
VSDEDPGLYDIAVIGGGVNGCGIARDAAGRGAKVLLLERGDLAQGTSSASTKLIHGGLRYLEHFEFGLVREALRERERLWAIAPHIIWPMRFVLPYRAGLRPRWLLRLGLFLYDHIGGRKALPPTKSLDLRSHAAGAPLKPGFRHGYAYSDGWVDDARLVVLNARDAADKGARVETRTEVVALHRGDGRWKIETRGAGQSARTFLARAVVNAAGPSVLSLLDRASLESAKRMRLVRGSHIVVPRLYDHEYAYFFQLADGRIFFAIPYERDFTLIGTTDRDHDPATDRVEASEEEIRYLCDGANQYFRKETRPEDVVWTYSGVRPLVDDGSGKPEAATRGYQFELDGGKQLPPHPVRLRREDHQLQASRVRCAGQAFRLPSRDGSGGLDGKVAASGRRFPSYGSAKPRRSLCAQIPPFSGPNGSTGWSRPMAPWPAHGSARRLHSRHWGPIRKRPYGRGSRLPDRARMGPVRRRHIVAPHQARAAAG